MPVGISEGSGFQHGASENPAGLEVPHCFLSSSPEHRISHRASPIPPSLINGPINKVDVSPISNFFSVSPFCSTMSIHSLSQPQSSFIQQSSAFNQAPKNREPPRYEEAVKQTRSLQNPTVSEVTTFFMFSAHLCVLVQRITCCVVLKDDLT